MHSPQIDDKPYDAPYRIIESFEASLLLNCRMDQSRGYVSQEGEYRLPQAISSIR